jgi:hypothetical protein
MDTTQVKLTDIKKELEMVPVLMMGEYDDF